MSKTYSIKISNTVRKYLKIKFFTHKMRYFSSKLFKNIKGDNNCQVMSNLAITKNFRKFTFPHLHSFTYNTKKDFNFNEQSC